MQKFYTIYKITNLLNGKIYVGKHETYNLNDGYMGSGKAIKKVQEEFGIENFSKEIIHLCENLEEMNEIESLIVNSEFIKKQSNYNLIEGGDGGWNFVNETLKKEKRGVWAENFHTELAKVSNGNFKNNKKLQRQATLASNTPEARAKSIKTKKVNGTSNEFRFWITNGNENKYILKSDNIPDGWYKGKVQNTTTCPHCHKVMKKSRWVKKHIEDCKE